MIHDKQFNHMDDDGSAYWKITRRDLTAGIFCDVITLMKPGTYRP